MTPEERKIRVRELFSEGTQPEDIAKQIAIPIQMVTDYLCGYQPFEIRWHYADGGSGFYRCSDSNPERVTHVTVSFGDVCKTIHFKDS